MRERQRSFGGPKHAGESKIRVQITADLGSAAKRIITVACPHIAAAVGQLANGTQMIAGIIVKTGGGTGFELHALTVEAFGDIRARNRPVLRKYALPTTQTAERKFQNRFEAAEYRQRGSCHRRQTLSYSFRHLRLPGGLGHPIHSCEN